MGNPVVGAARRLFRWDHQMDPRIAWVSPMPPARSGIASYSKAVLDGLERIGYTREHQARAVWPVKQKHSATIPWHTMAVYHLGNNVEFHGDIYDLAIRMPGLARDPRPGARRLRAAGCSRRAIRSGTRRSARGC